MRAMSSAMQAALSKSILYPIYFMEAEFASGTLRLWTGVGDRIWNGQTWQGIGWLVGFSEIQETTEIRATALSVSLNGVSTELLGSALTEVRENKPGKIWMGLLSTGTAIGNPSTPEVIGSTGKTIGTPQGQLLDDPILVFSGRCDLSQIDVDPANPMIRIQYENRLIDLERPRVYRYTHEDQQIFFPGDRFFEYMAGQVDQTLVWGGG